MVDTQVDLSSWENFISNEWFKAAMLKNENVPAIVVDLIGEIKTDKKTGKTRNSLILKLEYEKSTYLFELNKKNKEAIQQYCPGTPKQIIGRKVFFKKVLVQNPEGKEVDSLRIAKVEN